jgi:uncharacterized protein (DUF1697 family)
MITYVALLRGINVGKAKRVPMVELRSLFSGLGYENVKTLLNSGNVVFSAATGSSQQHAAKITAAILDQFQFEVPVVVKSARELEAIVTENPIATTADRYSRFLVIFLQSRELLTDLEAIRPHVSPPEEFAVTDHAAYLLCATGILESQAAKELFKAASKEVTTRNWATVLKLQGLANELAA